MALTKVDYALLKNTTTVTVEQFGAVGDGVTDDTAAFTAAVTYLSSLSGGGGGTIELGPKIYAIRNWEVKYRIHVRGCGDATRLKFKPSGNDATDATSYVVRWTGYFSTLENFNITGIQTSSNVAICNGLEIVVDPNGGFQRKLLNVKLSWFAGYKASPIGGTLGINSNYARADITDDLGNHLLTGGNGVVETYTSGGPWELVVDGLDVKFCDGIGVNFNFITDSKITNMIIGGCVFRGLILNGANCEVDKTKVYLCNRLDVRRDGYTYMGDFNPHQASASYDQGAVQIGGQNHVITMEVQENASHGVYFGSLYWQCRGGRYNFVVDGNGATNADPTTAAAYRRYGLFFINYYGTEVNVASDDLRAKDGWPRQLRAFSMVGSKITPTSLAFVTKGAFYRIKNNSGGADFTPLQLNYASPSNAVGTIFQARSVWPDPLDPTTNFGTGSLEVPNGNSIITASILNQYEKDSGAGLGYDITFDAGDSIVTVNGKVIQSVDMKMKGGWNTGPLQLGNYRLWVDATGDLRIKSSAPTSDTDGTVVGTQT